METKRPIHGIQVNINGLRAQRRLDPRSLWPASHPHNSSLTDRQRAKAPEQRHVFGRLPIRAAWSAPASERIPGATLGLRLRRADARLSFGDNREFSLFWPENSEAGAYPSRRAWNFLATNQSVTAEQSHFPVIRRNREAYVQNREALCAEQGARLRRTGSGVLQAFPEDAAIRPASLRRRPGPARTRAAAAAARAAA